MLCNSEICNNDDELFIFINFLFTDKKAENLSNANRRLPSEPPLMNPSLHFLLKQLFAYRVLVQFLFEVSASIAVGCHHILRRHFAPVHKGEGNEADEQQNIDGSVLQKFDVQVEQRGRRFHVAEGLQSDDKLLMIEHDQLPGWNFAVLVTLH